MAPSLLKTFVQNRVSEIHEITKEVPWRHISGKHNPADLVSRGVKLEDLPSAVLLFRHEHKQLTHAGAQALLYSVRESYWPVSGRDLARQSHSEIADFACSHDIKFKLIPPYTPHFGGLWEAGVKSCKHHLLRTVGNAHLTFEEISTVLAQIEAIMNSRPLNPLSSDPHDLLPLCPSHFLVGRPLTAPAFTDLSEEPTSRLTRYQRVEQIRQHFWTRWTKEYVSELQTRIKWSEHKPDLQPNTFVVIKEDNSPPLKWSLGRIITTIPGKDGVSRVADIRTATGVVRRAFTKICPLFHENTH
ncbi:uncharacterized protein LOC135083100 [Ostrinia nubilalis]|uniref:uncharacterized protein LOC135083100 n=1 Tax=Ostrinia nubilalis TaxID=29057 RepID=UPI00308262E6